SRQGVDAASRRGVILALRRRLCPGVLAVAVLMAAGPRSEDPDWPCPQRLVPRLTAAAYWSGPLDTEGDWRADPEIVALVRRLAPRRVSAEAGLAEIEDFAKTATVDRPRRLALVFRGL